MNSRNSTRLLRIWDLPTRLFHWSLLALILACWLTSGEDGNIDWHMRCGESVLALLLFRVVWGVLGSTTSRFSHFIKAPTAVLRYFATLRNPVHTPHLGHNPPGGWMVLGLLLLLLAITGCGLFANDDMMSSGPLAQFVSEHQSDVATEWHEIGFYLLLTLVTLHVSAILFYLFVKRDNLIRPMITGSKEVTTENNAPSLHFSSYWLALLVFGIAAWGVWTLAHLG